MSSSKPDRLGEDFVGHAFGNGTAGGDMDIAFAQYAFETVDEVLAETGGERCARPVGQITDRLQAGARQGEDAGGLGVEHCHRHMPHGGRLLAGGNEGVFPNRASARAASGVPAMLAWMPMPFWARRLRRSARSCASP